MRSSTLITLVAAGALLAIVGCSKKDEAKTEAAKAPASPVTAAKQKPGFWQMTMSGDAMPNAMIVRTCLDETMTKEFKVGPNDMGQNCSENSSTPQADGSIAVHSVCNMGTGGTVTTDGKASGDFSADYVMEATTVTTGAAAPQMNTTQHMKMEAKWLGACPEGVKPGDRQMDMQGMTVTMPGNVPVQK